MRTIWVQNQRTKCFLGQWGEWTAYQNAARSFPTTLNAIAHCVQKDFGHVQLVIRINGAPPDTIVPVDDESLRLARGFAGQSQTEA